MTDTADRFDGVDEAGSIGGFAAEFVEVDGIRTRYYDVGSDEPLVLIHGGSWSGSSSANTWVTNLAGLGERFRVIAFDRLGNGMTDNPTEEEAFVFESEVDHALSFIEAMGLEGIHLGGNSRGGGLAGRIAVERPDLVRSLVVVNSRTLAPEAGDYAFRRRRLYRQGKDGPNPHADLEDSIRAVYEDMSYSTDHVTDEFVRAAAYMRTRPKAEETAEVMRRGGRERYYRSIRAAKRDTRELIEAGRLCAPTLVYWGQNDPTSLLRQGQALFDQLSQRTTVRMYTVDHAGHWPFREYSSEFDRQVSAFVDTWALDGPGRPPDELPVPAYVRAKDEY